MSNYNDENSIVSTLVELETKIYEVIRPAREVDARAMWVWMAAFSLIFISIATKKPDQINPGGTGTIYIKHWIYIAIPIFLTLLYWMRDLHIVSGLTKTRIKYLLKQQWSTLRSLEDYLINKANIFYESEEEASIKRDELLSWYNTELDKLTVKRNNLDFPQYFGTESDLIDEEEESLEVEYNCKKKELGLDDHEKETDKIIGDLMSSNTIRNNKTVTNSIEQLKYAIKEHNKIFNMSVKLPMVFACISITIFLVEIFFPTFF